MLYVGGYPGIQNRINISTLYTFVNGQKKYFYKDYNVMENIFNKFNPYSSSAYDSMNYVVDVNDDYSYTVIFNSTVVTQKSYNNVSASRIYKTRYDVLWSPVTAFVDGVTKNEMWFWNGLKYNDKWALHELNPFFQEYYNGNISDYTFVWGKNGALLQKKIDNSHWEHYYMPYMQYDRVFNIDIPSDIYINPTGNNVVNDCVRTPNDYTSSGNVEAYISFNNNKILYINTPWALNPNMSPTVYGIYDIPSSNNYLYYKISVRGRYVYVYDGSNARVICRDLITNAENIYNNITSPINGRRLDWYFSAGERMQNGSIIKYNKLEEPTIINPFSSPTNATYLVDFNNKYRWAQLEKNSSSSKIRIHYIDDNNTEQSYDTNLPYNANASYSFLTNVKKNLMVVKIVNGSTINYYYSTDNVNFSLPTIWS